MAQMKNNTSAMEVVAKSIKKSSCRQGEPVESASWQADPRQKTNGVVVDWTTRQRCSATIDTPPGSL